MNSDQAATDHKTNKLVEALRLGRKSDTKGFSRSPELDAALPEGHPARVVWDYVAGQDLGGLDAAGQSVPLVAAQRQVMLGLWLYGAVKGVGSAQGLTALTRVHRAYRWLAGGMALDEQRLKQVRASAGIDEWLADALTGLTAAGIGMVVPNAERGEGNEARLLWLQGEARKRVAELRQELDRPGDELAGRLAARQERSRRRAADKVTAAAAQLASLIAIKRRQEEEARAKQRQAEEAARKQREEEARARRAAEAAARAARAAAPEAPRLRFRPVARTLADPRLPWSIDASESGRFRRILGSALAAFVVLALAVSVIKPPPVERAEAEKVPPRLAKLILEQKETPKPPPVVPQPKKEAEKKPEPEAPKEKEPEPKVETPKREVAQVAKPKHSAEEVQAAREKASKSGLLVMRDQLAALREMSAESLRQRSPGEGGGERELITRRGSGGSGPTVERDLIAQAATTGSGGVATKSVAHAGGGSLEARETTKVAAVSGKPSIAETKAEARGSKRTHEEIRLAFDANKSAIYAIYRRALRDNPLLEGRVVVKLTVDPSGVVTACSIVSSALKSKELEDKLVARIQLINFGTRPKLEIWTGTYEIDFVPAG